MGSRGRSAPATERSGARQGGGALWPHRVEAALVRASDECARPEIDNLPSQAQSRSGRRRDALGKQEE